MALARYFDDHRSLIGQYLWRIAAHTSDLSGAANRRLGAVPTVRPVADHYPWGAVAYATPYRLRAAFGDVDLRVTAAWRGGQILTQLADTPYPQAVIDAVFAAGDAQLGTAGQDEAALARLCYVLGLFEEVDRSPRFLHGPLVQPTPKHSLAELLAIPDDQCVADLQEMGVLFAECCSDLLTRPHVLFPPFGRGAANGQGNDPILVDGELLLIKTTAQPRLEARWLREMLGYVLLDDRDLCGVHTVSWYMARQGMRLTWPVAEFVGRLSGQPMAELRQEFAQVRRLARGQSSAPTPAHLARTA